MYSECEQDFTMSELIDEHVAHLIATGQSEKTIEARKYLVQRLDDYLPFGCLFAATEQIEAWLAGFRRRGRSKATLATYDYHARAFYRWATRAGYLDGDPMADLPKPRKPKHIPRPVTDEAARRALDCTGCWRIITLLATYQGMRCAEIAGCHREHIGPDWTYIPVAKGGDPATVPTHPLVWAEVRELPEGPLIVDTRGREVNGQWVSHAARRYYASVGLPGVGPHKLRHWYATSLLNAGVDIRTVQQLLRHTNLTSTMGYTQVTDARRQAAVRKLPDLAERHEPAVNRLVPPATEAA